MGGGDHRDRKEKEEKGHLIRMIGWRASETESGKREGAEGMERGFRRRAQAMSWPTGTAGLRLQEQDEARLARSKASYTRPTHGATAALIARLLDPAKIGARGAAAVLATCLLERPQEHVCERRMFPDNVSRQASAAMAQGHSPLSIGTGGVVSALVR